MIDRHRSGMIGNGLSVFLSSGSFVSKTTTRKDYDADEQRWSAMMVSAQQGDDKQYQQLLMELTTVIQRYLISRLGRHDFIEDCVQDILLAIHNGRHTYQPKRPFRPWMFAIVRNRSIDYLRKRKSYDNAIANQAEVIRQLDEEMVDKTTDELDQSIMQGRLIDALAPPFKQAIVLTKLIGYSNAEAAERLSISETAVKVRVHRGIAKLKSLFEAEDV